MHVYMYHKHQWFFRTDKGKCPPQNPRFTQKLMAVIQTLAVVAVVVQNHSTSNITLQQCSHYSLAIAIHITM